MARRTMNGVGRVARDPRANGVLAALALALSGCATSIDPGRAPDPRLPPPDATATPGPGASGAAPDAGRPLALDLCPSMRVSNAPPADGQRVRRTAATGCVAGVQLAINPAPASCLSSAFGPRNGRAHRGLDYQSKPAGPVTAGADGVLREVSFRQQDFGHWIVIDHGSGVHTGYAHLASVTPGLSAGQRVRRGQPLGVMGKTGAAAVAIHLHYEVRTGDFNTPGGWFTMKDVDPFSLPASCSTGR